MNRVTNQMINNTMKYNLSRQQVKADELQNQLATGKKIRIPRDNPINATNQMLYMSKVNETDQFISNINESKSLLNYTDSTLQDMTKIIQRMRVLAVQGSNGIYSSFELKEAAATEINQLLEELVSMANTTDGAGRSIFGGFETGSQNNPNPFIPIYQTLTAGNQGDAMIGVEYRGDTGRLTREVSSGEYIQVSIPGNEVFWATNQVLNANKDSGNYQSNSNQIIRIDGKEIEISAGDNIDIVIDKINNAGLSARASKGLRNNLILETTSPHQLWLEDMGSGTVLKDLGMINQQFPEPPSNIDPSVTIDGRSIFEMAITLRDDLVRGDQELVGGRDLGLLDLALENVLRHITETGAKQNRVDQLASRSEVVKGNMMELLSESEGIDVAETMMNFSWLESVHQYALAVGAKSIKPTLMDFLR
ncbi:MAG: flagellar hook-associated protein 3 [Spirochaetes bacterium]|nr:flagellar hook-associated protein 3 [Spirochaetota bacterium]